MCVPAPAFLRSQCCRGESNFERGTLGRVLHTVTHESCSRWFPGAGDPHTAFFVEWSARSVDTAHVACDPGLLHMPCCDTSLL